MTRLLDLLHSLTAVIIRYHDAQTEKKMVYLVSELGKHSFDLSLKLLNKEDYQANLNQLIAQCTKTYKERKSFLDYMTHEITFIKSMLDRKSSCTELELTQLKQQITQMLLDFKQLLTTSKGEFYKVTYSKLTSEAPTTISIAGLKKNSYFLFPSSTLCLSGDLVKLVLARLNLSPESSEQEIKETAENMCQELQNSLLVPELVTCQNELRIALKNEEAKVAQLSKELTNNKLELSTASKIDRITEAAPTSAAKGLSEQTLKTQETYPQISQSNRPVFNPLNHSLFAFRTTLSLFARSKNPVLQRTIPTPASSSQQIM